MKQIEVTSDQSGQRIDRALAQLTEFVSRSKVVTYLENRWIQVNGHHVKASYVLKERDLILILSPEIQKDSAPQETLQPMAMDLNILFEDDDLIVIDKPAGLVVHPAAGHFHDTLVNALIHHTQDLSAKFGSDRPGIVHRLDRDTSGVIVVAKNDRSHEALALQFRERTAHRIYHAYVYGKLLRQAGTIESWLARHPRDRKRFASVKAKQPGQPPVGKRAVTHYKVLSSGPLFSYLELKLETGRTHQIRVHLSELGHPIVGDNTYGADRRTRNLPLATQAKVQAMNRFALHATELGFTHPTSGQPLRYMVPFPGALDYLSITEK